MSEIDYSTVLHKEESTYESHWKEGQSDEAYHSDKTAVNSSSLRRMLKSPNAFHASFFLGKTEKPTEEMKLGTLAHMAILQGSKFKDKYQVMPDFGDMRSSNNKARRDAWLADLPSDAIAVTAEVRDIILGMVDSICSHEMAMKVLSNGKPEVSGYYVDDETKIRCRFKPDFVSFDMGVLLDVKTTRDSSWSMFRKSVENLKYDFQMSMYSHGVQKVTGKAPKYKVWLVVEKDVPYEVRLYEMGPIYEAIGDYEYRQSLRKLRECIDLNSFPNGQHEIELSEPSRWYTQDYQLQGVII